MTRREPEPPPVPPIEPDDRWNRDLLANAHPAGWENPPPAPRYNLVVLGAGTAGLVTAAGAAGLGARVALVERHLLGGDCLNVGCVPSKAVIRSARVVGEIARAAERGVGAGTPEVDFPAVMERMRRIRAGLSPHDSARRFRELGVDVFFGRARFSGPDTVEVAGPSPATLRFRRAVVATGARPVAPEVPGLAEAGFLTNETVFNLTSRPARLGVIGGGPIGCELAQAFRRLGCEVTLIHTGARLLGREDEDAADLLAKRFEAEGIRLVRNATLRGAERVPDGKRLSWTGPAGAGGTVVDEILAGAGRAPNVEGLGLERVGVRFDPRRGVLVDDRLRTTNRRIFAAGDVCLERKFTHAADFSARVVIRNALFAGRARLSSLTIPWCTYTDPEIAGVGLTEAAAAERGVAVSRFVRPLSEVDRAVTDGETDGFVKILVRRGTDRIVGATIVASHAGELIGEVTLAMTAGIRLGRIAGVIHPYPTQADAIRQVGDQYNRTRLTPFVAGLFRQWLSWTR